MMWTAPPTRPHMAQGEVSQRPRYGRDQMQSVVFGLVIVSAVSARETELAD